MRRLPDDVTTAGHSRHAAVEEDAFLTVSSEPTPIPVDGRSAADTRSAIVMQAFEEHSGRLTTFAYGMTRDRDAADDLVQEAFLRLVRELAEGRAPANVGAWLFTVCANLARSRGRRASVVQRFLRSAGSAETAVAADLEIVRRETHSALLDALATLPGDARAALLMASQGFSGREIAEAIGRTEMATRTLMFRAREKLRVQLVREEVHP